MAIIYSYPTVEPKLIDKILITQSYNVDDEEPIEGNPTKSVKISSIGQLLGTTGTANTIPMFSSTGLVDSQLTQIGPSANGLYQMKLSNTDRFIIDKTSSVTSGDPEYLITQDGNYKVSMGWDDDGEGFGFLYNWSGNGWRFGAAGNNPELTIVTTAGSEGVVVENKLTVQGAITAASISATTGTFTGQLQVERGLYLEGLLNSQDGITVYQSNITINDGNLVANGNVLGVNGNFSGSLSITGDLVSGGGVRMADVTDAASSANAGMLKYRISGNNSYVDMCMQTGAATYAWINIKQNNW